jgi:hypothetical protein
LLVSKDTLIITAWPEQPKATKLGKSQRFSFPHNSAHLKRIFVHFVSI